MKPHIWIVSILLVLKTQIAFAQCGCTFLISSSSSDIYFDGKAKGVKPGDKICLPNGKRTGIQFKNIVGTADKPVIITNRCDGKSFIEAPSSWGNAIEFLNSSHFIVSGAGNPAEPMGIDITGASFGMNLHGFTTDFTLENLNVHDTGCSAIVAKTDPTCDPLTQLGKFTLRNATFHDIKITNTGCEGFYIGNSHFDIGVTKTCSGLPTKIFEHGLDNIKVYNCELRNIGNDGIQVGGATNTVIHHNKVYGTGLNNNDSHMNGIQVGSGTTQALVYNNIVDAAHGYGIFDSGGGGVYYNNIVTNSFLGGMFMKDDAPNFAPTGFSVVNNTFINNAKFGLYMLSENVNLSSYFNNIIIGPPGAYTYIYINNAKVKYTETNNLKSQDINSVKFIDQANKNYRLLSTSPAIDAGKNVSPFGVSIDHDNKPRPKTNYDIGAFEFQSGGPTSNAGPDKTITLPTNTAILNGSGTSATTITSYSWTKKSGGNATLVNQNTANLTVNSLEAGVYVFALTVTDAAGTATDEVTVTVLPVAVNQNPTVNAGTDKSITLPVNLANFTATASDADGSIVKYTWIQLTGPTATLANANTATLTASSLVQGTYDFQITVEDNNAATASDVVRLTVLPAATNAPPTVNAGADKVIFTPTNSVVINASASDVDGTIATILWELKSGPTATLTNTTTLNLTASALVVGVYNFRITVTDNKGASSFDEVQVSVVQANQNPTANAGPDKTIVLPTNSVSFSGSGADSDGSITAYAWTQLSGPSTATLANNNTATLTASNLIAGTYRFRLTVTDNKSATGSDEVQVIVQTAPVNKAPIANAGADNTISLPQSTYTFAGTGSDPDGTVTGFSWTQISGPTCTLSGAGTKDLTAQNLVAGKYVFRLRVTDNASAFHDDDVTLTVLPAAVNQLPTVNAGPDQSLTLPQNSVTLNGNATDPDGTISAFQWTQQSGPAATITGNNTKDLNLSNLVSGTYIFQLRATDNGGASATDLVSVIVKAANAPPVVDLGNNRTIVLPVNTITISSTVNDPDGTIASFSWVKASGPAATLVNSNTGTLTVNDLVVGTYEFSLTVTDDAGATGNDVVQVQVLPLASNNPPSVSAGSDQTITLPSNTVNLEGTAFDSDGTIATYAWTVISGSPITLTNASNPTATASGLAAGEYVIRLTATDNQGASASDDTKITVQNSSHNNPPSVSAGANIFIQLPTNTVTLSGSASDTDGTIASYSWEKVSGPSAVLQNASTSSLSVEQMVEGAYVFRLTVRDDKGASAFADVKVVVFPESINQTPIADAGANQSIRLPVSSTVVIGSSADIDGTITSSNWSKLSGPSSITISDPSQQIITLTNLVEGVYILRFTVVDNNGAIGTDEVTITVNNATANVPPVANAGGNQVISLPTTTIELLGSGSDADGSIASYEWAKVSGGSATLSATTTPVITVAFLEPGTYTFKLRVTDDKGAVDEDIISVVVNPEGINKAPVANAGTDKVLSLPISSATITGTGSDTDGQVVSYLWEKKSVNTINMADTDKPDLLLSNLSESISVFRLTVADDDGYKDFDEMTLTVTNSPINAPPVISLRDTVIHLPQTTLTIKPTVQDEDGTIQTYLWIKLSGPSVTMGTSTVQDLVLSNLVEGIYKFQLTATDDKGANSSSTLTVTVLPASVNQTPTVNAGAEITITLPINNTTLNGSATDKDGTIVDVKWTKISGPTAFILSNDQTLQPSLTGLTEGVYVFQLTATDDDGATASDNVNVTVNPVPPNQPPLVNAGGNLTLILPANSATLSGSATDADGTVVSFKWTQIEGPNTPTLAGTSSPTLGIADMVTGTYIFKLEATDDDGATGAATSIVLVAKEPQVNTGTPIVYAGEDVLLILPDDQTIIIGNALHPDPDGTIAGYEWTQTFGPVVNLTSEGQILQLDGLETGKYAFKLTAFTDDIGSASDEVIVGVIGANDEIPKFFSPNNDGTGDMWVFRNADKYLGCNVEVYNRSGIKIFSASPYENNWNGTTETGSDVKGGDYYYKLACPDGRQLTGALRIIK
jgi:gliding motility-associated-like protein